MQTIWRRILCWVVFNNSLFLSALQEIGSPELAILIFHTVNSILSLYCIMCVTSQLHDLMNGKGTKDYYRRLVRHDVIIL